MMDSAFIESDVKKKIFFFFTYFRNIHLYLMLFRERPFCASTTTSLSSFLLIRQLEKQCVQSMYTASP